MISLNRRRFIGSTGAGFAALAAACSQARTVRSGPIGYGPLLPDPAGLIDLPSQFTYRVLSAEGEAMSDGARVPGNADGMGCFALGHGKLALVRNHELVPGQDNGGASGLAYDRIAGGAPLPGGTTTLVLDAASLAVERQYRSLSGTIRNCSGGVTPWGSWLTCEEFPALAGGRLGQDHGWVFEVPAAATGPVDPVPLKAMGRFNHEAATVDPASGIVYLTEDRDDGLLYRFIPNRKGHLAEGGELQALAISTGDLTDSRNWEGSPFTPGTKLGVRWVTLDQPESPKDDLRKRGLALGAMRFARGEGVHLGLRGRDLFFVCTSGGAAKLGQVFRLTLGRKQALHLFYESTRIEDFNFGDNLTVAPDGQLVVCEDQYTPQKDNHLRGVTRDGVAYKIGRLRLQTELAGACFSPDGRVLFVNAFSPAKTLAITGPWQHLR